MLPRCRGRKRNPSYGQYEKGQRQRVVLRRRVRLAPRDNTTAATPKLSGSKGAGWKGCVAGCPRQHCLNAKAPRENEQAAKENGAHLI